MVDILKIVQSEPLMISCSLWISTMGSCLSFKIPIRFVVVKLDALDAAEAGEYLHNVILLIGRELVFAVMVTIVGTHACAKV